MARLSGKHPCPLKNNHLLLQMAVCSLSLIYRQYNGTGHIPAVQVLMKTLINILYRYVLQNLQVVKIYPRK